MAERVFRIGWRGCRVTVLTLVALPAGAQVPTGSPVESPAPSLAHQAESPLEMEGHGGHRFVLPSDDERMGLADVVARAVERDPRLNLLAARRDEVSLLKRDAGRWLAGAPAVTLDHVSDAAWTQSGYRQWDAMLEIPLWWPGQRGPRGELAQLSERGLTAAEEALRLTVAGEVRDAIARLALARAALDRARRTLAISEALARDVERAVSLGERSRLGWLAAREVELDHREALVEAEAELFDASLEWRSLTGLDSFPAQWREGAAQAAGGIEEHPFLVVLGDRLDRTEAELAAVKRERWSGPEVAIGTQHERETSGSEYDNRLVAGFRVPFGRSGGADVEIARVVISVGEARTAVATQRRSLELALHEARHQLETAILALEAGRERAAVAAETHRLARRAFDLGEIGMSDLLRIQARAEEAERAREEAELRHVYAVGRLNQALGVLP